MNNEFNLIELDIEEFKERIGSTEDEVDYENQFLPNPISYNSALKEAKVMLDDFDSESSVKMVLFEYKNGYQVDVVSSEDRFEIYEDLYKPEDVVCFVFWNKNRKETRKVQ